ncbi:hypothetical protein GCM10007094_40110 [Pseudovibrio japonicus]|uniref:N-acetyltransferase domain-containing protein n=1 Tax=Pseudovibrio japonicus TaxID=366534 RepID=A0ABQ3EMN9_9HYPH|nr:hypothetical protein GCM10007094_40110 [Pseudovibrio japonicus]
MPQIEKILLQTYPTLPEDIACARERLRLFPDGCYVLRSDGSDRIFGYVVSHPWQDLNVPPLSSLLRSLPISPEVYFIHDIALLPDVQGIGAAKAILAQLSQVARRHYIKKFALVAMPMAESFWQSRGFRIVDKEAIRTTC